MSLGTTAGKLRAAGVETVAVVATPVDRARRYFRYRPPRCLVGADPEVVTHRAFGVPYQPVTDELMAVVTARADGLAREAGLTVPAGEGWPALDRTDGIELAEHVADMQRHQAQLTAQFLIGADGIVRWTNIECELDGLDGLDRFPSEDELLEAARILS